MHLYLTRNAGWIAAMFLVLCIGTGSLRRANDEIRGGAISTDDHNHRGKTSQGFPYQFGGVGSDEREALEERAKGYNVKLVFAEKRGAFVSGVSLQITTAKGAEIAALKVEGPWFYIQLPPGAYSVKARLRGEIKEIKNLTVPKDKRVQQGVIWDLGER